MLVSTPWLSGHQYSKIIRVSNPNLGLWASLFEIGPAGADGSEPPARVRATAWTFTHSLPGRPLPCHKLDSFLARRPPPKTQTQAHAFAAGATVRALAKRLGQAACFGPQSTRRSVMGGARRRDSAGGGADSLGFASRPAEVTEVTTVVSRWDLLAR